MPVDESDPIDVAMRDRKVVGGSVDSVISAADVKAQKLQLPKNAPALSVDKPKEALLAVISNEMISTTEEESKAPKQTSTFTKSSSPTTPVATATAAASTLLSYLEPRTCQFRFSICLRMPPVH
mmetsp:Transcript_18569/g.24983  ORF Transcript_18569/g.24983 Transcript_18569/m.24983 type:complete len:124 (+) Transcript_18569:1522-1893(+)